MTLNPRHKTLDPKHHCPSSPFFRNVQFPVSGVGSQEKWTVLKATAEELSI
jgi:hypothetical protein